jgi:hypothetical protein
MTRNDIYTISDMYAHMLSSKMCHTRNGMMLQVSSANNANRVSSGRDNGRGGRGRSCGGRGDRGNGGRNSLAKGQNSSGSSGACQICGRSNHNALQCWYRFDQTYQAEDNTKQAAFTTNTHSADANWYVDTGATYHITNEIERLTTKERYIGNDQIQVANGSGLTISHIGNSSIVDLGRSLLLKQNPYAHRINRHLMSVRRLAHDNNAFIEFHPHCFFVKERTMKALFLAGRCKNGLYILPHNCLTQALLLVKVSKEKWHRRLGHPASPIVLRIVQDNNLVVDANVSPSVICHACQLGKAHQLPFSSSQHVSTTPLQLIHTDVWGPALSSINNSKYYVSFVDDFSRYVWIYFLKNKSDVEVVFLQFQKHVEKMLNAKICSVQSDWEVNIIAYIIIPRPLALIITYLVPTHISKMVL